MIVETEKGLEDHLMIKLYVLRLNGDFSDWLKGSIYCLCSFAPGSEIL